jgi:hypothetical protein
MSAQSDEFHKSARRYRTSAFAELMDIVYRTLSPTERDQLPRETGAYVNALVAHALGDLAKFGDDLRRATAGTFDENVHGERFILDPMRTDSITTSALYLDERGNLVSVTNPELERAPAPRGELGELSMVAYQSYTVLTGPEAGQTFPRHVRKLPDTPRLQGPHATLAQRGARSDAESLKQPEAGARLKVFICHASEDKPSARRLARSVEGWGHDPWLDEEKLVAGQEWDPEIRRAVREADVVLVCLSNHFGKRGYVQKEVRLALDVADEQPEGAIYLIPVKLEDCPVPDRLTKWQWVDLFESAGQPKLEAALRLAAVALHKASRK